MESNECLEPPLARQRLPTSSLSSSATPAAMSLTAAAGAAGMEFTRVQMPTENTLVLDMPIRGHHPAPPHFHQDASAGAETQPSPPQPPQLLVLPHHHQFRHQPPEEQQQQPSSGTSAGFAENLLGQSEEWLSLLRHVEKYIPFVLILMLRGVMEHLLSISIFLGLIITCYHSNSVVCREVSRQQRRTVWPLLAVLINLSACTAIIYSVFKEQKLYLCLVMASSLKMASVLEVLWVIGVNDFVLKFIAVSVKTILVFFPSSVLRHKKRGNYFMFVERSSQLHRQVAPIPIWIHFLLQPLLANTGADDSSASYASMVSAVVLSVVYVVLKSRQTWKAVKEWRIAAHKLRINTRYGESPSQQELRLFGDTCPICHDSLSEPIILHCRHIFCEDCVATWFDKEKTCPMCRAQVAENPVWRDGSTAQFIQLF